MTYTKLALLASGFGLVLVALILWDTGVIGGRSDSAAQTPLANAETVGDRRKAILRMLTETYVSASGDVGPRVAAGEQLAPPTFLNKKLAERGAKWRVRDVEGLAAQTYIVS